MLDNDLIVTQLKSYIYQQPQQEAINNALNNLWTPVIKYFDTEGKDAFKINYQA